MKLTESKLKQIIKEVLQDDVTLENNLEDYMSPEELRRTRKEKAEKAAEAEAKKESEKAEIQQNIKIIEKTTNFEDFIKACDRAAKLIKDIVEKDDYSLFHKTTFELPGTSNEESPVPLKDFLKKYNDMPLKEPRLSNPFSNKQNDYKLDEQNIKKILAASKKILYMFKESIEESEGLSGIEGVSDFNLLARPGLFGVEPDDANMWRTEIKQYAREVSSTPDADDNAEDVYKKIREAAIELIKESNSIDNLSNPNDFIKKYGRLYRSIDKVLSTNPSPTNVNNILYINPGSTPEEESKAFISFVKSIVKSKPESSLTKSFSLARKYKVKSDQDANDKDLPKIMSSMRKLVDRSVSRKTIKEYEEMFKFTQNGGQEEQYSFITLSENIYNMIFDGEELDGDFLESEAVKQFYDKEEEEDVSSLPMSREKQIKIAAQKITNSLEKAYESALSLQVLSSPPERNKPIKLIVSGIALELPAFEDVMQGTVGPDKQSVKDFNKSVQEIYDTSSDEEKSDIEKKHRVVAAIIARYTKVYQVANRGLFGKIFNTDTLSFGGKFGLPKFDLSHGFFGGKKVLETLLYGTPSKLLKENKREVSMLYAMAIRESIQDMKNEKYLGISNENLSLELNWLIEDIKRNNIEKDVLFYLKRSL